MPNLKSAKKSMRQNARRRERNMKTRTRVKNTRRSMMEALKGGDVTAGAEALRTYSSALDKAAKKGVIAKNTAIRRKNNAANGLRKMA